MFAMFLILISKLINVMFSMEIESGLSSSYRKIYDMVDDAGFF